jgi:ADP-ribosylglycohydrolase
LIVQIDLDQFRGCLQGLAVGDADITAAIRRQLTGAFYGETNIPVKWLKRLFMRDEIRDLADGLAGFSP